jgi:hypothetical protein
MEKNLILNFIHNIHDRFICLIKRITSMKGLSIWSGKKPALLYKQEPASLITLRYQSKDGIHVDAVEASQD